MRKSNTWLPTIPRRSVSVFLDSRHHVEYRYPPASAMQAAEQRNRPARLTYTISLSMLPTLRGRVPTVAADRR